MSKRSLREIYQSFHNNGIDTSIVNDNVNDLNDHLNIILTIIENDNLLNMNGT